jgi:hypothetical protein
MKNILYFYQKWSISPILSKIPFSYISDFGRYHPCRISILFQLRRRKMGSYFWEYSTCILIRAYVGNQGKGSYKRLALISIGTFIEMI